MSENKPNKCQKCGFVDCKCIDFKISYETPEFDNHRKIEPNFELDKIKEELNKIKKTENLEIKKIEEKIKSSKDDQEIIVLSKLIMGLEPTSLVTYFDQLGAFMRLNQLENAEKCAKELITTLHTALPEYSASSSSAHLQITSVVGQLLYENKKYDESLEYLEKALALDDKYAPALYWNSIVLYKVKKFKDALLCCNKIIAINTIDEITNPQFVCLAWIVKSDIQDSLGEYQNALESIDEAISINENNSDSWKGKGTIYQNLANHADALECFEKALALDENNVDLMNYKGVELLELQRFDEAKKCLMDIISIDKFHEAAWGNLAAFYIQGKKNFTKALECSSICLVVNPDNVNALVIKGIALVEFKKYEDALECAERLLNIDKNDPETYLFKAQLLGLLNSKSKALECYDEVLSMDMLNGDRLVICLIKKAKILFESKEYQKSINVCNDVLAIDGNNLEALYGKCQGLYGLEEYQKCLDCSNKILAIDGNDVDGLISAESASLMLQDNSKAEEYCNKILTIDKNHELALYNKAHFLKGRKKYAEALKYMNRFIEINPTQLNAHIENAKKLRDELIELIQSK